MPGMMSLAHASFYGIKTRTNRLTSNGEFLVTSMAGAWGVQQASTWFTSDIVDLTHAIYAINCGFKKTTSKNKQGHWGWFSLGSTTFFRF